MQLWTTKKRSGWGIAAGNWQGKLIATWAYPRGSCLNAKVEEALALRAAMVEAKKQGWRKVIFESDCKQVVDKINAEEEDAKIATVLCDIKSTKNEFD